MQQRPMNLNNGDIIANDVDDEESKVTAPAQVTVNQTGRFASISNVSFLSVQFIPVFANSHFLTCDRLLQLQTTLTGLQCWLKFL